MTNPLRVKILSDGIHAKEVNPLGEEPVRYVPYKHAGYYTDRDKSAIKMYDVAKEAWDKAESKLRTFEIDILANRMYGRIKEKYIPDLVHTAELLPNGKIKIID